MQERGCSEADPAALRLWSAPMTGLVLQHVVAV